MPHDSATPLPWLAVFGTLAAILVGGSIVIALFMWLLRRNQK